MRRKVYLWMLACFLIVSGISAVDAEGANEVVLDAKWGTGEAAVGLLDQPELERCGPLGFSVADGQILLLDTVRQRVAKAEEKGQLRTVAEKVPAWSICSDGKDGFVIAYEGILVQFGPDGKPAGQIALPAKAKLIEGYGSELTLTPSQQAAFQNVDQKTYSVALQSGSKGFARNSATVSDGRSGLGAETLSYSVKRISSNDVRILGKDTDGKVLVSVPIQLDSGLAGAVLFKGQDEKGRLYVELERLENNYAHLEVHQYSTDGKRLKVYALPNSYYTTVYKKTEITPKGAVYQMLTTPDGVQIIRY